MTQTTKRIQILFDNITIFTNDPMNHMERVNLITSDLQTLTFLQLGMVAPSGGVKNTVDQVALFIGPWSHYSYNLENDFTSN